ncbi:putative transcriptional regulator, fis family [Magnetococcus marinus MC-1]|uniref:Putative transcriptional regulator, fis family n=1 Tax=Magnetococcus marinus (strain ATCC BAA-1437 / JCM 17883 / MC-1) TaxID=156889 RepID=A0L7D9_MAGMM|nr:putative transcriptional regulator, fis family [Magnetococcus marinus MC-1]
MNIRLHANATTTPRTRKQIQDSTLPVTVLASELGITTDTVRRWKGRTDTEDRSHTPHHLQTTLSPEQEAIAVELRQTFLLPLDDLLVVMREFVNPDVSRSGLDRCLRRHGVSRLRDLIPQPEGEKKPIKTFKDYEPSYVHVDYKYLPQMPNESSRRYLFVAIDRASRWVSLSKISSSLK